MRQFLNVVRGAVVWGAAATFAVQASAQTTRPPARPAPSPLKPVSAAPGTRLAPHPGFNPYAGFKPHVAAPVRHPVFVPPPEVIELDEFSPPPDLPQVLNSEDRERYRRIFEAQAKGRWGEADAEIARLGDKTLMGYVGAQRLLARNYVAKYEQLAAWLQDYNDHPDAPAIYRLALARRPRGAGELTPASFVSQQQPSPTFAAARTVTGADAAAIAPQPSWPCTAPQ